MQHIDIEKMAEGYPPSTIGKDCEEVIIALAKSLLSLQQNLDAVLADNVALKEQCAGEMSRAANDIAYAIFNLADMKMTDLKPGIIESTGPAETALIAERNLRNATAQLRAETDTTPSQYESLAGGK